jgi:hypothetical protein
MPRNVERLQRGRDESETQPGNARYQRELAVSYGWATFREPKQTVTDH